MICYLSQNTIQNFISQLRSGALCNWQLKFEICKFVDRLWSEDLARTLFFYKNVVFTEVEYCFNFFLPILSPGQTESQVDAS